MSRQSDLAFAHQRDIISLGHQVAARVVGLWRHGMSLESLDESWQNVAPAMARQVMAAQVVGAKLTTPYLNAMDASYAGFKPTPAQIIPATFANVMGDGREVAPALFGAVTNTKTLIGQGVEPLRAFESGAAFIALVAQGAIHDMSRNADRVLTAGKGYTRYIRVVNGNACSRCAILAGMASGPEAFQRHVSCQCSVAPIFVPGGTAKAPEGFQTSANDYFYSLSREQQDRVFTKAGAEAIRQGADPVKVVNARRGAYGIGYHGRNNLPSVTRNTLQPLTIGVKPDGSPLRVYATTEGTTARGSFGKSQLAIKRESERTGRYTRTTTVRLMPEQIAKMAGDNSARYVELLRKYGYLY